MRRSRNDLLLYLINPMFIRSFLNFLSLSLSGPILYLKSFLLVMAFVLRFV